jgi:hypothetical protein
MKNTLNHSAIKRDIVRDLSIIRSAPALEANATSTQNFTFPHGDLLMPVELKVTIRASSSWVAYRVTVEMKSILAGSIADGEMVVISTDNRDVNSVAEILEFCEGVACDAARVRNAAYHAAMVQPIKDKIAARNAEAAPLYELAALTPRQQFDALPEDVKQGVAETGWQAATAIMRCLICDIVTAGFYVRILGEAGLEFQIPAGLKRIGKIHDNVMGQDLETVEILRGLTNGEFETVGYVVMCNANGWETITDNTDNETIAGLMKRAETLTYIFAEEVNA